MNFEGVPPIVKCSTIEDYEVQHIETVVNNHPMDLFSGIDFIDGLGLSNSINSTAGQSSGGIDMHFENAESANLNNGVLHPMVQDAVFLGGRECFLRPQHEASVEWPQRPGVQATFPTDSFSQPMPGFAQLAPIYPQPVMNGFLGPMLCTPTVTPNPHVPIIASNTCSVSAAHFAPFTRPLTFFEPNDSLYLDRAMALQAHGVHLQNLGPQDLQAYSRALDVHLCGRAATQDVATFVRFGDVDVPLDIRQTIDYLLSLSGGTQTSMFIDGHLNLAIFFRGPFQGTAVQLITVAMTPPRVGENQIVQYKPRRGTFRKEMVYRVNRDNIPLNRERMVPSSFSNEEAKAIMGLYECPLRACPFITTSKVDYDAHLFLHLPNTFTCHHCNNTFFRDADFEGHIFDRGGDIKCLERVVQNIARCGDIDVKYEIHLALQKQGEPAIRRALEKLIPVDHVEHGDRIANVFRKYPLNWPEHLFLMPEHEEIPTSQYSNLVEEEPIFRFRPENHSI